MRTDRKNVLLALTALVLISCTVIFCLSEIFEPDVKKAASHQNYADKVLQRDGEIRAVWIASVSNINFPSSNALTSDELKTEINAILDTVESNSMNTVIFQVRPSSDALYPSEIFPSSAYICRSQGQAFPDDIDILKYLTEEAHSRNIAVCAWVNPLRVTTSTTDSTSLAKSNPARQHPEYTVAYNGALYYDPGLPEVRELVCNGVYEIADGYDVDAIVFDDYFYPYPGNGEEFDDSISYIKYGSSKSLEQWRRENINTLIEDVYKTIDGRCYFGISPFGIWQNNNGTNGGSDTNGLSAYDAIYCDALAWAAGGYVDFISPQIYWDFDNSAAPYAVLCDWWNEKLSDTDTLLIISHAAYKAEEWDDPNELSRQIDYARKKPSCIGSAIYGYAVIKENYEGICEALAQIY